MKIADHDPIAEKRSAIAHALTTYDATKNHFQSCYQQETEMDMEMFIQNMHIARAKKRKRKSLAPLFSSPLQVQRYVSLEMSLMAINEIEKHYSKTAARQRHFKPLSMALKKFERQIGS